MTDGIGLRGNVDGRTDDWHYRVEEIEMSWYFELAGGGSRGSELAVSACLPSITSHHNQDLSFPHRQLQHLSQVLMCVQWGTWQHSTGFHHSISSESTGKYIGILTTVISVSRALLLCCDPGQDGRDSSVIQYQRQSHFQDSYKQTKRWGPMGWCVLCSSPTANRKVRNDEWLNSSMCYMVQAILTTQAVNSHACSSGGWWRFLICPYHLHSYLSS